MEEGRAIRAVGTHAENSVLLFEEEFVVRTPGECEGGRALADSGWLGGSFSIVRSHDDGTARLRLDSGDGFAVGGDADAQVVVGIFRNGAVFGFGIRNDSNLAAVEIRAGIGGQNEKRVAIGQPGDGIEQRIGFHEYGFLPGGGIVEIDGAGSGIGQKNIDGGDGFAVRRPLRRDEGCGLLAEKLFVRAVHVRDHQVAFAVVQFVTDEGEASAIGREGDVCSDVVDHALGISAENGEAVQACYVDFFAFAADQVEAVSVRGKSDGFVAIVSGRYDLSVALGGDIAQPDAFLAGVELNAGDVFPVRRNGGLGGFARIGDWDGGETFKRICGLAQRCLL